MTDKAKKDPGPELKKAIDNLVEACEHELLPALKKMQDAMQDVVNRISRISSQIAERIKRSSMTR